MTEHRTPEQRNEFLYCERCGQKFYGAVNDHVCQRTSNTKIYAWTPSRMEERGGLVEYAHWAYCGEYVKLEDYERLTRELAKRPTRDAEHCDYPDCEQHNTLVVERLRATLSHVRGRAKLRDSATLLDIMRLVDEALSDERSAVERGVCCVLLSKAVGYEPDEIHEYLCGTYWGWKQKACPKTPSNPRGIKDVPIRTTTTNEHGERDVLSKQDYWDFVEFIQRFGAKHGVMIPDPDPDYWMREEPQRKAA